LDRPPGSIAHAVDVAVGIFERRFNAPNAILSALFINIIIVRDNDGTIVVAVAVAVVIFGKGRSIPNVIIDDFYIVINIIIPFLLPLPLLLPLYHQHFFFYHYYRQLHHSRIRWCCGRYYISIRHLDYSYGILFCSFFLFSILLL
jgi:hypothetical protein